MPFPPQQAEAPEPPEPPGEEPGFISIGDQVEGEDYVIVSGNRRTVSGSSDDPHIARAFQKISGDYIWFRRDGKEYIIRDKATIERAKALSATQGELGQKEELLGRLQEQEEFGRLQKELAAKQEQLRKEEIEKFRGQQLAELREDLKRLEAELSAQNADWTQENLTRLQSELAEMQGKVAEARGSVDLAQAQLERALELAQRKELLGRQQGELGREQGRLGREANRKMRDLLDDAIKRGIAQPAPK